MPAPTMGPGTLSPVSEKPRARVRGLNSGQSCTDVPSVSVLASASPGDPRVATPAVGLGWNCSIWTAYSRGLLFSADLLALAHKVGCQPNEVFE